MAKKNESIEKRPQSRAQGIGALLTKYQPQIAAMSPGNLKIDPDRFVKIAVNCILNDSSGKLQRCTDASLLRAVMHAAEVGLEPGGAYSHCYLIPYRNKDLGADEATFMISVHGYVQLAYRSNKIRKIEAEVIREKDDAKISSGTDGTRLDHEWDISKSEEERGKIVASYAVATLENGETLHATVSASELKKARASNRGKNSAWDTWESEMAKKVAIKRLSKMLPKTDDRTMDRAIELEEHPEKGDMRTLDVVAEVEGVTVGEGALDREVRKQDARKQRKVPKSSPEAADPPDSPPPDDEPEDSPGPPPEPEERVPGQEG